MYYSVLPINNDNNYQVQYKEIKYKNQLLLTKTIGEVQVVERLYSTNPEDYLDPAFQPGTILENPLINKCKRCYNKK